MMKCGGNRVLQGLSRLWSSVLIATRDHGNAGWYHTENYNRLMVIRSTGGIYVTCAGCSLMISAPFKGDGIRFAYPVTLAVY